MNLSFGTFSIQALLMAFSGGVFGACAGGIQGFVILGIVGIGAMALNAAGISFLLNVAFGYWLFPAIWFTGYCVALSFAGKRGLCDGKALTTPLIILRSPAVLAVGGVAGVAGYSFYYLCNNVLGFRADNGAVAVVTICLLWKLLTEKTFIGRPSNMVQAKGGRFSTRHDQHWIPYLHDGPTKLVFGLALSGASAAAVYAVGVAYGALDDLSIWASHTPAFISFFISAATLVFAVSSDAAASHQTTLSAGYAFCCSAATGCDIGIAFLWAIGIGMLATFLADFFGDVFMIWGDTWIDPPAVTHLAISILVFNLPAGLLSGILLPILCIVLTLVLGMTVYRPVTPPVPGVAETIS